MVHLKLEGIIDETNTLALIREMEALVHTRPQPKHVRIRVNSEGGKTTFGILLYHYFRYYPLELTVVNAGKVRSSAAIAFLGAEHRMAIENSTFMIHPVRPDMTVFKEADPGEKEATKNKIGLQEEHIEEIYNRHLKLSPQDKADLCETQCDIFADQAMSVRFVNAPYSKE